MSMSHSVTTIKIDCLWRITASTLDLVGLPLFTLCVLTPSQAAVSNEGTPNETDDNDGDIRNEYAVISMCKKPE
jgi:hypothetical protein